jgi:hypothetical protein
MIYFKRVLITLLILISGLIASGFFVAFFYGDAVKNILVNEINKRLDAEVKVKNISFSVFDAFPLASLEFHDIQVKDAFKDKQKNTGLLFSASRVYLSFNVMAVFNKRYAIKKITITNGNLHLKVDSLGNDNYHFLKVTKDTSQTAFRFALKGFKMEQTALSYSNQFNHQFFQGQCTKMTLSGEFNQAFFEMEIQSDLVVNEISSAKIVLLKSRPVALDFKVQVSDHYRKFECKKGSLSIADLQFELNGISQEKDGQNQVNFFLDSKEMNIASALSLIPSQKVSKMAGYEAKGICSFRSHVFGVMDKTTLPRIDVAFSIHKGEVIPSDKLSSLKNIEMTGMYTNGDNHDEKTSSLVVSNFSSNINKQAIKAHFSILNFSNPFLKLSGEGACNLADMNSFVKMDTLEYLKGTLVFKVFFEGRIHEISKASFVKNKVRASGDLEIHDVGFQFKHDSLKFHSLQGMFTLESNNLEVQEFKGNVSGNDFKIEGILKNFVSYVFLPDQDLSAEARFASKNLNLDDFIRTTKTGKNDTTPTTFFSNMDCNLQVTIGHMHFKHFECKNITGEVIFKDKIMTASQVKFATMDGHVSMNGSINGSRKDSVFITCNATVARVNVAKLFYQMDNFGQSVLESKHLNGFITSEFDFASVWSRDLSVNPDKIVVKGKGKIENGELIDFKPLLALSKFVKINELKRIQFSTLQNEIFIINQKIVIPSMEIKSNALNLNIAGVHTFENKVDYKLTLLLSDLLGKKLKERHVEFGEEEDDGLGKTKLFVTMKGDISDPVFAYDKAAVKQKIKADLKSEKETLKKMFREEFGWFKKDSLAKKDLNKPSGKGGIQIDTEEEKPEPAPVLKKKNAFSKLKDRLKAEDEE